ncbi:hybrid sensor histidine kinase/response regulator, partial [filamentous cyanobacterium CCP5]
LLAAGCDDFLYKPFKAADIFRKLSDHLGAAYVLAETTKPGAEGGSLAVQAPSPDSWQQMSADWRQAVHQAAIQVDADWLRSLVAQIPPGQAELKPYLTHLIEQFDFDTLIALTSSADD